MPPVQESLFRIYVNAPPGFVFDYLANPRNMGEWYPGTGEVELDTIGAIGQGTRFRFCRQVGGKTRTSSQAILAEYERPTRLAFVIHDEYFEDITQEFSFKLLEGGTILQRHVFTSMNLAHALLARLLIAPLVRPLYENSLGLLKQRVEARARPGVAGRP